MSSIYWPVISKICPSAYIEKSANEPNISGCWIDVGSDLHSAASRARRSRGMGLNPRLKRSLMLRHIFAQACQKLSRYLKPGCERF